MLDTATSFYAKIKSCRIKSNLSSSEAKALRNLTKQKDIIIQKADKGNSVVILDKESYIVKMKELLSDTSKFERPEIPPHKYLNLKFRMLDAVLEFYVVKLTYTNPSLTIAHLLDLYLMLVTHHRKS